MAQSSISRVVLWGSRQDRLQEARRGGQVNPYFLLRTLDTSDASSRLRVVRSSAKVPPDAVIQAPDRALEADGQPVIITSDNVLTTKSTFPEKTMIPVAASGREQRFCDPRWVVPVWSSTVGVIPALP